MKKTALIFLLLGCICTFPVMGQTTKQTTVLAAKKADHSSRQMIIKSFLLALADSNTDMLWDCFAPTTLAVLDSNASEEKMTPAEFRKAFCYELRTDYKKEINLAKKNMNKAIEDLYDDDEFILIKIKGKWYIDLEWEEDEEDN